MTDVVFVYYANYYSNGFKKISVYPLYVTGGMIYHSVICSLLQGCSKWVHQKKGCTSKRKNKGKRHE